MNPYVAAFQSLLSELEPTTPPVQEVDEPMQKSITFSWMGWNWRPEVRDRTLVLVKAGKSKVAPGQMSLFDEQAHPRDEGGKFTSKEGAIAKMKGGVPAAMERLSQGANQIHQRIKSMSMDELENYDPDGDFNDNHLVEAVEGLRAHGDNHEALDEILDSSDEHFSELHEHHAGLNEKLMQAHEDRMSELSDKADEIHTSTVDGFGEKVSELLDGFDDESAGFAGWQQMKGQIQQTYQQSIKSGYAQLKQLGAGRDAYDNMAEELKDALDEALDSYSNDPGDWEDWEDDG